MPKTLEELTRDAERKEYAARCEENAQLRAELEIARRGRDRVAQELDRAVELRTQAEVRFNEVLAEREALKAEVVELNERIEYLLDNERVNANA